MAKAKFYIRMDTYWQGSRDTFFGPYETQEAAQLAVSESGAGRWDLGQMARDVKNQTRCLGILNTTEAHKQGMNWRNTIPARDKVPGDLHDLAELEEAYLV